MSRLEKAREKKYKRKKKIAVGTGALCLLTLVGLLAFSGWNSSSRPAGQDILITAAEEESDAQNDLEYDDARDIYDPFDTEPAVVSYRSSAEPDLPEKTEKDEQLELADEADEEVAVEAALEEQFKTSVQEDAESEVLNGELIDSNKSAAFIDFFALTHVHVYISEGRKVSEVSANGMALAYRDMEGRWELVMDDFAGGEELSIVANCAEDTGCFQEMLISVEEF